MSVWRVSCDKCGVEWTDDVALSRMEAMSLAFTDHCGTPGAKDYADHSPYIQARQR